MKAVRRDSLAWQGRAAALRGSRPLRLLLCVTYKRKYTENRREHEKLQYKAILNTNRTGEFYISDEKEQDMTGLR